MGTRNNLWFGILPIPVLVSRSQTAIFSFTLGREKIGKKKKSGLATRDYTRPAPITTANTIAFTLGFLAVEHLEVNELLLRWHFRW